MAHRLQEKQLKDKETGILSYYSISKNNPRLTHLQLTMVLKSVSLSVLLFCLVKPRLLVKGY